jgi:hypothetical protein
MEKTLLILDLDIFMLRVHRKNITADQKRMYTRIGNYYVWKKSVMIDSIPYLKKKFTLAIWSSLFPKDHLSTLLTFLLPDEQDFLFIWDRSYCCEEGNQRPLQKVWKVFTDYDEYNTYILNDNGVNPIQCKIKTYNLF